MFTHEVSCSRDKGKLEALQHLLETKALIQSRIKDHPIFGYGLYTTKGDQEAALLVKEQFEVKINVITGEVYRGTT